MSALAKKLADVTDEAPIALVPRIDIAGHFGSSRVGLTPRIVNDDGRDEVIPAPVVARVTRSLNPAGKQE